MENQSFFSKHKTAIIVLIIVAVVLIWAVSSYNSFVSGSQQITAQWAQVENQYQRRFDLIPNLVNTVKGYAAHEDKIYQDITTARASYTSARTVDQKAAAASQVEGTLGRLLAIAESNPQLQASGNFHDLSVALEGTENRISVERMKYNDLVRSYDTAVQSFPSSIMAKLFGFGLHEYFNVPAENQVNPTVNF